MAPVFASPELETVELSTLNKDAVTSTISEEECEDDKGGSTVRVASDPALAVEQTLLPVYRLYKRR